MSNTTILATLFLILVIHLIYHFRNSKGFVSGVFLIIEGFALFLVAVSSSVRVEKVVTFETKDIGHFEGQTYYLRKTEGQNCLTKYLIEDPNNFMIRETWHRSFLSVSFVDVEVVPKQ